VDREQHHRGGPASRPAGRGGPGPGTRRQAPGWPGFHRPSRPPASLAALGMPARQGGGITRPGGGQRRHRTGRGRNDGIRGGRRRQLRARVRRRELQRAGVLAAVAGIAVLAAGCGGGSPATAGQAACQRELACAQCMRGHGDPGFPGPQSDGTFTTTKRNRGTFSGPPGGVAARHPHRHHPVQRRCQFTAVQGRVHALQATAARGGACTVDREPHRFSEPSGRFGARQCPGPRLIRPGAATPTNGKDEGMNHRMRGVIRAGTAALLSHPGRVRAGPCFWAGRASWQTAAKPRARPGAAPQSAGACPAGRLRHRWIVAWMARMGGQDAAAGRLAVRTG